MAVRRAVTALKENPDAKTTIIVRRGDVEKALAESDED
jgi:hypothetical protein